MKNPAQRVYDQNTNHKSSFLKRENRGRKARRFVKLFFLIVFLFALGNLLIKLPSALRNINKPFDKIQSNKFNDGSINKDFRTNILLISLTSKESLQDLALASFNYNRNSLSIISIPISSKVYTAGEDLALSPGATYFAKPYFDSSFDSTFIVTKELLALPLDGYFVFDQGELEFTEDRVNQVKGRINYLGLIFKFFSYKSWLNNHLKTNYSISKLMSLSWAFKNIKGDKLQVLELKETVENKQFNIGEVDSVLRETILDSAIANEGAVVEVVNGGEGNYPTFLIRRVINNLGASTISLGGVDNSSETKVILGSDKNKVAARLAKFLAVKVEKGEVGSGADVKVIIGEDFDEIFYGK